MTFVSIVGKNDIHVCTLLQADLFPIVLCCCCLGGKISDPGLLLIVILSIGFTDVNTTIVLYTVPDELFSHNSGFMGNTLLSCTGEIITFTFLST